jgi:hypothetical protein
MAGHFVRRDVGPQSLPVVASNPISGGGGSGVTEVLLWNDPWETFTVAGFQSWNRVDLWNYTPTGYYYLASGIGTGPDYYGAFQSNDSTREFTGFPILPSAPLAAKFSIEFSAYNPGGSTSPDGYMCFETPFCTPQVIATYNGVGDYTVSLYNSRNFVNGVNGGGTPVGSINIGSGFSRLEVESDINGGWVARLVPPSGTPVSFSGAMPVPTTWSGVTVRLGAMFTGDGLYVNDARFVEITGGASTGGGGGPSNRVDYPYIIVPFAGFLFGGSGGLQSFYGQSITNTPHKWYISGISGFCDPVPPVGESISIETGPVSSGALSFQSNGVLYSSTPVVFEDSRIEDLSVTLTTTFPVTLGVYVYIRWYRDWL